MNAPAAIINIVRIALSVRLKYFVKSYKRAALFDRELLACWTQTCRCTSSGCTICAVRRRRYARSDRNVAEAARAVNLGPITRTSPNRQLDPCSAATGYIGVRADSSSGLLCSPATRWTKSPCRYRGNSLTCMLSLCLFYSLRILCLLFAGNHRALARDVCSNEKRTNAYTYLHTWVKSFHINFSNTWLHLSQFSSILNLIVFFV